MPTPDLQGRTFLVTGANSGIGRALSEALAARRATVILAGRSPERTSPVVSGIQAAYPEARVSFLHLDLADWVTVHRAAREVSERHASLDVLVNNAGVAGTRGRSRDGYHLTYAVNHLGPFLLTQLLLPLLRDAPQGRVVNVASVAHRTAKQLDWSMLTTTPSRLRGTFQDYAATKLMNVLHARELARRLTGSRVTTSALHPGGVATNIWRALPFPLRWLIRLFLISSEEGARTPLYCATAQELATVSGRYYDREQEAPTNPLVEDPGLAAQLWQASLAATGAPAEV